MPRTAVLRTLLLPLLAAAGLAACSHDSVSPTEPIVAAAPAGAASAAAEPGPGPREIGERRAGGLAPARAAERGRDAGAAAPDVPQAGAPEGVNAAAKGGNGKGKGGNGGNRGKGGNNPGKGGPLRLALQPDVWNTNWANAQGTVSALITGDDLDLIDLGSIVLVGTDPAAVPLAALRAQRSGNHLRAFFAKDDALSTLDTPTRGEVHEVEVRFMQDGAAQTLTDEVRVVGPAGGGGGDDEEVDLGLAIQPDAWNVNWSGSAGTVSALIRGDGLDLIDLGSIVLVGTDPAALPLPALRAQRSGNHVRAFFAKSAALATLDTPTPGETHEVAIQLTADGAAVELTDTVRIVGPAS